MPKPGFPARTTLFNLMYEVEHIDCANRAEIAFCTFLEYEAPSNKR